MNSLPANVDLYYFVAAIIVASFGFLFYFYISRSAFAIKLLKSSDGKPLFVMFQRFLGVFIFGIIPLVAILAYGEKKVADFGIVAPVPETYTWIIILSAVIIFINYLNATTAANLEMYPQIRSSEWSLGLLTLSSLSWIFYLVSYEFLYRGFLFFATLSLVGLWPAIVLNTAIYALIHIPKGFKETVGAIPLGVLLCYLTFRTDSIWVAVFTHVVMAISNEWFSLRAHPQMVIKIKRK